MLSQSQLASCIGSFKADPDNDYIIEKMAKSELRVSVYGARYIVSFIIQATVVPLIAWAYHNWGFEMLFYILAASALVILFAVLMLPQHLPESQPSPS